MPIIPWEPFREMDKFFEDDFFRHPFPWHKAVKLNIPSMDVYEKGGNIIAEMEAPGINPSKVNIEIEGGYLRVSGKEEEEKEEKEKNYYRKEIRKGAFERLMRLPCSVKEDKIEAKYENGLLKVVMPKKEERKVKKIEVKIGKK